MVQENSLLVTATSENPQNHGDYICSKQMKNCIQYMQIIEDPSERSSKIGFDTVDKIHSSF